MKELRPTLRAALCFTIADRWPSSDRLHLLCLASVREVCNSVHALLRLLLLNSSNSQSRYRNLLNIARIGTDGGSRWLLTPERQTLVRNPFLPIPEY